MKTLRLSAFLLMTACPVLASAQTIETHSVRGRTTKALIASLKMYGPNGGFAATETQWSYSYKAKLKNGFYEVYEAKAKRTTVFKMPFWRDYNAASTCMKNSWDAMYVNLAKHERKHWEKAAGVTDKIEAAIMAIKPQRTEAAMTRAVKRAAGAVINLNRAVQLRFDKDTRHGITDPDHPTILAACPD